MHEYSDLSSSKGKTPISFRLEFEWVPLNYCGFYVVLLFYYIPKSAIYLLRFELKGTFAGIEGAIFD